MISPPPTIELMARVSLIRPGRVAFRGFNSWYSVPTPLMPVFRGAKQTGRKVTFTADRGCNILAADSGPLLQNSRLSHHPCRL
jgi:hypothetical protein